MRELTVYRTTDPRALHAWRTAIQARKAWAERVKQLLAEDNLADRHAYVDDVTGKFVGVSHTDGDPIPDGWRYGHAGYLVPALHTAGGKQIRRSIGQRPDPAVSLPGMRVRTIAVFDGARRDPVRPEVQLRDGVLYVVWAVPLSGGVDLGIWERVRTAEYAERLAADERAQAVTR